MTVWKHLKRFRFWIIERATDETGSILIYRITAPPGSPWEPSNISSITISQTNLETFNYVVEQPVMCRCSDCEYYRLIKEWRFKR